MAEVFHIQAPGPTPVRLQAKRLRPRFDRYVMSFEPCLVCMGRATTGRSAGSALAGAESAARSVTHAKSASPGAGHGAIWPFTRCERRVRCSTGTTGRRCVPNAIPLRTAVTTRSALLGYAGWACGVFVLGCGDAGSSRSAAEALDAGSVFDAGATSDPSMHRTPAITARLPRASLRHRTASPMSRTC